MSRDLLQRIDARADALGLTRSQYIAQLARADIAARGDFTLRETEVKYKTSTSEFAANLHAGEAAGRSARILSEAGVGPAPLATPAATPPVAPAPSPSRPGPAGQKPVEDPKHKKGNA